MTRTTAIVAADLHLLKKPGMWTGRAEISGDDVYSLQQIAELTRKNDADLYLLGDVLDNVTNLPRPIVAAQQVLGELAGEGRVSFLQGQHELVVQAHYENHPWLSLIPGTVHIGGRVFDFLGHKAYGLDYFPYAFEALAMAKIPEDTEVLFLHGTIDTVMSASFHVTAESLSKLPNLQLVLAGDYHQALELSIGDIRVFYTGSTWQTSADEQRDKSVIIATTDGDKIVVDRIPLVTRSIFKISELYDGEGEVDTAKLSARNTELPEELQTPVLLVDRPTPPEVYEELVKHAHLYTTSGANPDIPVQSSLGSEHELSNEQVLRQYADKDKYPEQFAFTLDVIESNVDQAISRLRTKMNLETEDLVIKSDTATDINLDAADTDEDSLLDDEEAF